MALDRDLQLNALLGITQAINNNLSEDDLFRIYKFTLLGDLKVAKMALFVREKDDWVYRVHLGTEYNWTDFSLDDRFDNITDELSVDSNNGHFGEFDKVFPILHKNRVLALLFMSEVEKLFNKEAEDLTFVKALTNIIIVAVENKRMGREQQAQEAFQKELEIANKIQHFLFPKTLPNTPEIKVEAFYLPHHNVGGDYYDYVKISEKKFLICVADVSGKGVPAALLMSNFQASLRTLIRQTPNLTEIVHALNFQIRESAKGEKFITCFTAIYDHSLKTLIYVNAGHNAPLLIDRKNGIRLLEDGSTILGMFEPLPFINEGFIDDLEDFTLFCYTDGVTETENEASEEYGPERLEAYFKQNHYKDLKDIHHDIILELDDFKGKNAYKDDITMLTCRVE